MAEWNPQLYLKFGSERTRPAVDLLARVQIENPRKIVDVGCGPGNSTSVPRDRWPAADILGMDSSESMIATARRDQPEGKWLVADLKTWQPEHQYDLVFSNAVLQWLDHHRDLVPRLFEFVAPGGALALQIPAHFESPLHKLMLRLSELPQWNDQLAMARRALNVDLPINYYNYLANVASRIDMWVTEYHHVMTSHDAILEWIRATGLRPYLDALSNQEERSRFEKLLLEGIREQYPVSIDGRVLFPFRRLFIIAYRS